MESISTPITEFDKTIEELLYIGDCFKLREKQLEQEHVRELDRQKNVFNVQLQKEKKRTEQVQKINCKLTEQIEEMTGKQIDLNENNLNLNTKYMCCLEESSQFKAKCNEKNRQIEQLEKQILILKNDQIKLKIENQNLLDKIKEISSQSISDNSIQLAENQELRKTLTERDNEIIRLNEQLDKVSKEVEERLLQHIIKLKTDFGIMFNRQSTFFLQKIALLKEEQHRNIAKLYQHQL